MWPSWQHQLHARGVSAGRNSPVASARRDRGRLSRPRIRWPRAIKVVAPERNNGPVDCVEAAALCEVHGCRVRYRNSEILLTLMQLAWAYQCALFFRNLPACVTHGFGSVHTHAHTSETDRDAMDAWTRSSAGRSDAMPPTLAAIIRDMIGTNNICRQRQQ